MNTSRGVLAALGLLLLVCGAPAAADPDRAEELFQLCAQCHGERGEGYELAQAPAIAGLSEWYVQAQLHKFKSGVRGKYPGDTEGLKMHPMAKMIRDDEDIASLAAYVASLPATWPAPVLEGGDPTRGQSIYVTCTACHGPDAAGMEVLDAPNMKVTNDWYLLKQLHKFKSGMRGSNPEDVAGIRMRAISLTLPDDQAMRDVVAYITTLAD